MNKEQEMILRDAYMLIYDYTDDNGWCTVCDCDTEAGHLSDCIQQKVLAKMEELFPDINFHKF